MVEVFKRLLEKWEFDHKRAWVNSLKVKQSWNNVVEKQKVLKHQKVVFYVVPIDVEWQ